MRLFNNTDKEMITLLQKGNKRLEQERNDLLAKLHEIEQYKEDYEKLVDEVKIVKEKYESLTVNTETIFEEYKDKLENVIEAR